MAVNIKPYYTSDDLIEAVKRSISLPVSQNTFSKDEILRFANEEMLIDQVPAVLSYHEEYYVFSQTVALESNVSRYPLPSRSVGMKLRDVAYMDANGNLFEMSRIEATDKAFFQRTTSSNAGIHKFYIEGNNIVLTPQVQSTPTGSIVYYYYIRPNQLVDNTRAAISSSVADLISVTNKSCMAASVSAGSDNVTIADHGFLLNQTVRASSSGVLPAGLAVSIDYYLVNVAANTFQLSLTYGGAAIDITDIGSGIHTFTRELNQTNIFTPTDIDLTNNTITVASHLYMDNDKVMFSSSNTLPTEIDDNRIYYVVSCTQNTFKVSLTSGGAAISLQSVGIGIHTITSDLTLITCTDDIPDNIANSTMIDFLQTEGGHVILDIDYLLADNAVSGATITMRNSDLPDSFVVGDYIGSAKEAIIPFLPSDLHYGLAERTCARILSAINDKEGLALSGAKMQRIEQSESRILKNRVEGSPEKILARHSILRYGRIGHRRRF